MMPSPATTRALGTRIVEHGILLSSFQQEEALCATGFWFNLDFFVPAFIYIRGGMKRVKEAIVFEAAPAKERVEGVQRLLPLHRLGVGAIDVGRALRWKCIGI